jgi:hypothetical protein
MTAASAILSRPLAATIAAAAAVGTVASGAAIAAVATATPPTPSPCTGSLAAAAATSVSSRALTAAASESCAAAALAAATVSYAALALTAAAIRSGLSPSALFAAGTAHAAADVAAVAAPPVALSSVKHISRWNGSFVCNALATRLFPQSHSHPNCCQSGGFNEPSAQAPAQVIAHVLTQIAKQMPGWSTAFPPRSQPGRGGANMPSVETTGRARGERGGGHPVTARLIRRLAEPPIAHPCCSVRPPTTPMVLTVRRCLFWCPGDILHLEVD